MLLNFIFLKPLWWKADVLSLRNIKQKGYLTLITQTSSTGYFIYKDDTLGFEYCKMLGIISEIVAEDQLLLSAINKAKHYASYPALAFMRTRASNNRRFIEILEKARKDTIEDHAAVFMSKQHQNYMNAILNK